jgi:transposase-like protein
VEERSTGYHFEKQLQALNAEMPHHLSYDKMNLKRTVTPALATRQKPLSRAMARRNRVFREIATAFKELYDTDISLALESVFLALGINIEGQQESPREWLAENASVDGLKGFPDAINAVYLELRIQLCGA